MSLTITRGCATWLLAVTAGLFSTSGLCVKLSTWQPLSILGGRSLLAIGVMLLYLRRPRWRWNHMQVLGAVAYLATQLTFIWSTKLTTAANAILLEYTCPIYAALFGYWILKERPQRVDGVVMAVIFGGMLLFFGDRLSPEGFAGNVIAIIGGACMGLMIVCLRSQKDGRPAEVLLLGNLLCVLVGLPAAVGESFNPTDLAIIGYLGIFQIGLSMVLYTLTVPHLRAVETSLILALEPILNPLWVFLAIGEVPGPFALLGGALVLGAVTARAVVSARGGEADRGCKPSNHPGQHHRAGSGP